MKRNVRFAEIMIIIICMAIAHESKNILKIFCPELEFVHTKDFEKANVIQNIPIRCCRDLVEIFNL